MKTIHWLGVGLSSIPGIRRLASKDYNLIVWNRTFSKAEKSIDHVKSSKVYAKKLFILIEKFILLEFNQIRIDEQKYSKTERTYVP